MMFPGIFEWVWDTGHLLFMGIFWTVVIVLVSGLVYAVRKSAGEASREVIEFDELRPGKEKS